MQVIAFLIIGLAANGVIVETNGPNQRLEPACERVAIMSDLTPGKVLSYTCKY